MIRSRFLQALNDGPLVFDGAMGTQLYERGGAPNRSFDEMSVSSAEMVEAVHRDYLNVGVDVVHRRELGGTEGLHDGDHLVEHLAGYGRRRCGAEQGNK